MKLMRILLAVCVTSCIIINTSCNKTASKPKLKTEEDSVSYYLGLYTGTDLKRLEVPQLNTDIFNQAVKEALKSKEGKIKLEEAGAYLNTYFTKLQVKMSEKYLKEGQDFLTKNKQEKNVKTTASGLQYEAIKEATGPKPGPEDEVTVQYKGTLLDGTVFDSSYDRGQPATFTLNHVIPGWSEALQLMSKGAKYKIWVPSELAYGQNPPRGSNIKPNMALIFEVELLDFKKPQPENAGAKPRK